MPLAVDRSQLSDRIADLARTDPRAAEDARVAIISMLGGEDSEFDRISLHILQDFLWYELPRKWAITAADQQQVADALARVFDTMEDPAWRYAALCRSEVTHDLLREWERDPEAAMETYLTLAQASPVEPPDTDLLEWGAVTGAEEARLREEAAQALEDALPSAAADLDDRELEDLRIDVTDRFLETPLTELDGQAPIDVIRSERVERWSWSRSDAARRIRQSVLRQIMEPPEPDADMCLRAIEPLHWLLERAAAGIELTATGALARSFVREAVERYPEWWPGDFGPPNQEAEVIAVGLLRQFLRDFRLVRRQKRRLKATRLGYQSLADPVLLWSLVTVGLLPPDGFSAAAWELAAASVLAESEPMPIATLSGQVYAAIVAEGWSRDGEAPEPREIDDQVWGLVHICRALGFARLVGDYQLALDEEGRTTVRQALHGRAIQARHTVF